MFNNAKRFNSPKNKAPRDFILARSDFGGKSCSFSERNLECKSKDDRPRSIRPAVGETVLRSRTYKRSIRGFTPLEIRSRTQRLQSLMGFTILEVLLAVSISSLALVMAYSAFRIGWFSYRRLENQSNVYLNLRSAFNKISKDVRNSLLFKTKDSNGIYFEGKEKEMSFVTLMRSKDKEGKDCVNVVKVFYKFKNNNLLRAYLKNTDILKTDLEIKYDVFLTNITELKFYYAAERNESSEFEWKNSFDAKDALPLVVRIKLTQKFDMLPEVTFTKSIICSRL